MFGRGLKFKQAITNMCSKLDQTMNPMESGPRMDEMYESMNVGLLKTLVEVFIFQWLEERTI